MTSVSNLCRQNDAALMEETLTSPPPKEETLTSPPPPKEETLTSPPPKEETLTSPPPPKKETLTSPPPKEETLTSLPPSFHTPQSPTIPFDLILEILCRLSVKFLVQFRSVCKSWNSLISDPKFAKKQLGMSTTHSLNFVSYIQHSSKYVLTSYPLNSVFTDTTPNTTSIEYSINNVDKDYTQVDSYRFVGSCNGILCMADGDRVMLWNPSITKINELPPLQMPQNTLGSPSKYFGFGYDSLIDHYKVVVVLQYVLQYTLCDSSHWCVGISEVKVHTLGTNLWKTIQNFPFSNYYFVGYGKLVSGTIIWLAYIQLEPEIPSIVSFDLGKESFQEVLLPDHGGVSGYNFMTLGVLRDCLCVTFGEDWTLKGVWIMKEYGNRESWTKLFNVSYMGDPTKSLYCTRPVYIFEDDQVLLNYEGGSEFQSIMYNSINGTFKPMSFESIQEVCVDSLISPCS